MEIIEKQVEKVKEVPTDSCYGYGYGRRDINGKANAGLTLGIIGTALGAWALFGNRRGSGLLGLAGSGMGGSNININGLETGLGTANGITSPSAFQAWEKSCEDAFNLYKSQRDADDSIRKELSDLKAQVAINAAVRPYQDKLIQCEIDKAFTAGINYTDRKTCKAIYGEVCLPNTPVVTGYVGANQCGCPRVVSGTTATA